MRRPRFKAPDYLPKAYYHCVSRIVNRDFVLGTAEKEHFLRLMRLYESFGHLRVIAHCVMSNHFHILVEVPKRPPDEELPSDEALVAHVGNTLGKKASAALAWELNHLRKIGATTAAEALRGKWFARMWDVSAFMKSLKQRFSQWFNRRHKRCGTLWEDRFRSVLVQGEAPALKAMAAYIELNPVRAGICDDPKDYRWSSHGEAVSGGFRGRTNREILRWLVSIGTGAVQETNDKNRETTGPKSPEWLSADDSLWSWRCFLFGVPLKETDQCFELSKRPEAANISRRGIPRSKALEVLANGGRLTKSDYLRCRVRYFTDGVALGSKDFIEAVFQSSQHYFSKNRKIAAHRLRGLELTAKPDRLYNLRQLQRKVFG